MGRRGEIREERNIEESHRDKEKSDIEKRRE
jgi:hypothetical protein